MKLYVNIKSTIVRDTLHRFLSQEAFELVDLEVCFWADAGLLDKIVAEGSSIVIDYECFKGLWKEENRNQFEQFPSVILLLNNKQAEEAAEYNLTENFAFSLTETMSPPLLKLIIGLAMKRYKKRMIRKSEELRYKNIFKNSTEARLLCDQKSGKIKDANLAAAKIYDISIENLIGQHVFDLHENDNELVRKAFNFELNKEKKLPLAIKFKGNGEILRMNMFIDYVDSDNEKLVHVGIQDVTEIARAEELIHQQHEVLRSTIESIDDLFFTLDKHAVFTEYYQPDGSNHFALSSDLFVGKNISEVGFPDEVVALYKENISKVIATSSSEQIDYYLEAFGTRLWYNAKISPRTNSNGVTDGVTVLCRDVTRQKKVEETLKRARDFYLTLLADFPTMIWRSNTAKRADYFNQTWLEFTGRSFEDELYLDWVEKIHPNDVSIFLSILLQSYKTQKAFQIEHRLKHQSGEYRWVLNAGSPYTNLEGQFSGFIGSCYDITEARHAQDILILQKSAMESALEGICILEQRGKQYHLIYANKELEKLTKIAQKDMVGMDFFRILGKPKDEEVCKQILGTLNRRCVFKGDIECGSDSTEIWRHLYVSAVKGFKGEGNYSVAVLNDITDAKIAEKALKEKNKELSKTNEELDRFVYSTSHELRSPLMSVLGLLNLMEEDGDTGNYLQMIRSTINKLDKIIHDIIDYSRNSRLEVRFTEVDFDDTVDQIIQNLQYKEGFDKVDIITECNTQTPFWSDAKRIQVVLNNLISNSLNFHNFSQAHPYVEIKIKTSPINALIIISDNGRGIEEKHIPFIYDMFYRGTEDSQGSGIGLYITKEIVEKLKGKIQFQSIQGEGTSFVIDIPNKLDYS